MDFIFYFFIIMAYLNSLSPSLTWNVEISKAVSCSASNNMASSSGTLDISDTTARSRGGAAERCYAWTPHRR